MRIARVPLLLAVVLLGSAAAPSRSAVLTTDPRPNIVLILTDDQRFDELSGMPIVQSELVGKGVSFDHGYVVNPLCCPSRTTILTGRYSHSTGVYGNDPPNGGFQTFHDTGEESSTIATWLHDAGYHTGLVGKYLNGYTPTEAGYVPPGWDTWNAQMFKEDNTDHYYNYSMSVDGQGVSYGSDATDYSTDILAGFADAFIRNGPADQPLFLYFAPSAPHAPATPPPRYDSACPDVLFAHSASFNEEDVADKPQYIATRAPLSLRQEQGMDRLYLNQCRALLAADDAVGTIISALSDTGRLSNTLIVFASDNGVLLGEHRWRFKKVPYEEASRIPLVARYDPLTAGVPSVDHKLVANLDFAPTFADAGAVEAPGAEGQSFLPLLSDPKAPWRARFLIEHMDTDPHAPVPTYCAVHTQRFLYVDYATGEEELYDLSTDPLELTNLAGDPAWDATRKKLHRGVVRLCSPPPPGYTP